MRRHLVLALALVTALVGLTSCRGGTRPSTPAGSLPPGGELVRQAAVETRTLKSVEFEIATEGSVDQLGIKGAKGTLTREGGAQGTASVVQGGSVSELSFVLVGETLHVKGPTGGWQKLPLSAAATVYDPSRLLKPDSGVAAILATARDTVVEGRETVAGVDTYRVRATMIAAAVGAVAPGLSVDVGGTLWIGADRKLLHKAAFAVPGGGQVTISFRAFDAPVTITTP